MAKIYTRVGDDGETALFGSGPVRKDDLRVEAMGSVDELNAALGVVRTELARGGPVPAGLDELLARLQHRLFDLGAELATPRPEEHGTALIDTADIAALETAIDEHDARLEPLRAFILPGGFPAAAQLHFARCVCRRAERQVVRLKAAEPVRSEALQFLNRLGDLLFVLARAVNRAGGMPDVIWQQGT